jgi:succinate dehydrogenase/fumarate reductase-like Fe-S protein
MRWLLRKVSTDTCRQEDHKLHLREHSLPIGRIPVVAAKWRVERLTSPKIRVNPLTGKIEVIKRKRTDWDVWISEMKL